MEILRPSLRVHVVGIVILLWVTLAFVALTSKDTVPRIFFAFFCVALTAVLTAVYRKESVLAKDQAVASGTVTELKKTMGILPPGGRDITYKFVASDGKQYQGESDWDWQRVQVGSEVLVLYDRLDPAVNKPSRRFLFYSFQSRGPDSVI